MKGIAAKAAAMAAGEIEEIVVKHINQAIRAILLPSDEVPTRRKARKASRVAKPGRKAKANRLGHTSEAVLAAIKAGASDAKAISEASSIKIGSVRQVLFSMKRKGVLSCPGRGRYVLTKGKKAVKAKPHGNKPGRKAKTRGRKSASKVTRRRVIGKANGDATAGAPAQA